MDEQLITVNKLIYIRQKNIYVLKGHDIVYMFINNSQESQSLILHLPSNR